MAIAVTALPPGGDGNTIYQITGYPSGTVQVSKSNLQQDLIEFIINVVGNGTTFNTTQTFSGQPAIIVTGPSDGVSDGAVIRFYNSLVSVNTGHRWSVFQDNTPEPGANVGSDFDIEAYDDSGNSLGFPFVIIRSTGFTGIGFTAAFPPAEQLEVGGNIQIDGSYLKIGGSSGIKISEGTGSPNGAVTGRPGDMYLNRLGGAATTLYVKESGSATNTGWVGK